MKIPKRCAIAFAAVLFCLGLSLASLANADDNDPPGRVARLGLADGQVSFSPAGTDDWVTAVVNRPVTTGDKLWTDHDSRAELHVGSAAFRIGARTGFSFLNLSDQMMQVRLTEGVLDVRVRRIGDNESIEIDTPNLALSIVRPGRYRIGVNEAGDTTVINVRDGQGEVTGGGSAYTVHAGEQAVLSGTDTLNADFQSLAADDDFDNWCNERDLREEHAVSRRYVSDDVIGYEDLDEYGGWRPDPQYGNVWFPHVSAVDWAPYRYGHWIWISPWGWTWVDSAPWGFAPFHYGRWIFVRGAWGWVPCPPPVVAVGYIRPVYAPALVAWVGGPHFGFGFGVGAGVAVGVNVGWFPLGPREVFVPSYPVSRVYVNNVNISNTTVNQTVINNYYNTTIVNKNVTITDAHYMNQGVPGGVTATTGQNFTSARPVNSNLVKVDPREATSAPVGYAAPSVAPQKQAVLGAGAPTNNRPPAALLSRPVVAKATPPPPPPTFARQQAAIEANQGRPITIAQTRQLEPDRTHATVSPVRMAPAATPKMTGQGNTNRGAEPGPLTNGRPANSQANSNRPPAARNTGNSSVDTQLEQKHQEQIQQLQQKQDQERQKLDEQRYKEQQQLQKQSVAEEKQKQIEDKQQQQIQQLEQKHDQQQEQLKQKQEAEHVKAQQNQKQAPAAKSKPEDKPHH